MSDQTITAVPRRIEITTIEQWEPVRDIVPLPCQCGHEHYARQQHYDGKPTNLAPQWRFCEGTDCGCDGLRHVVTKATS